MKKLLSLLLSICVMLTMFTVSTFAATSNKLTTAEQNIVKAYQKTLETNDAKYINKYKYSGVTFKVEDLKGVTVKILNPKYSKVYDSKVKMYKLCINGILIVTDGEMLGITKAPSEIYVKTKNKKLYAYGEVSNGNVKMLTVEDLSESETLVVEKYLTSLYDEDTAYALMYPEDEEPDSSGSNDNSSADGEGTFDSPIALNQKHTWSETKDCLDDTITGTYSCTVKGIQKISVDELVELGFRKPEANSKIEYALVDVLWEVKDATIKKVAGEGSIYLNVGWDLDVWGVRDSDKDSIIGATDYGFKGSFSDAMDKATDLRKLTPGMKESFKAQGKVLVTLFKNSSNYMAIRDYSIEDYDSSFIYFKLN